MVSKDLEKLIKLLIIIIGCLFLKYIDIDSRMVSIIALLGVISIIFNLDS